MEPGGATPHWVRCDLSDRGAVREAMRESAPENLLALGWHMGPGNQAAVENYSWVGYSVDMLAAFAEAGGRRVVFCGSCMEYDWSGGGRLDEATTPLLPDTAYGRAKAALFSLYGPLCDQLGLSAAWARPFFLYGPGESPHRLVPSVIISCLKGEAANCSHGRQRRDFLHVADLAAALRALLESDVTGPLNIGSGAAVPLSEVILEAARQIGRPELVRLGALPARANDVDLVEAEVERLRQTLNFKPRYNLQDGIAHTIDWWRRSLKGEVT